MANKRDYYEVLSVVKSASDQEIKSAYRKLAVRYHPDRNPGDTQAEEKFKEAAEAYAVLSDPEKRARYDRFGHQVPGGFGGFDASAFSDFSDILGDLFGLGDVFGGRRWGGGQGMPGSDLRYDLKLTFEQAAFGYEAHLRIPRLESCGECSGTGSKSGRLSTCATCNGQGRVRFNQGFLSIARACPQCGGEGKVVTDPCPKCRGEGRVERERELEVKVPPGVDNGLRLRLRGEGEHGRRGGPPGDLDVILFVEPHKRFERRGADVYERVPLSYPELVLGATIQIETLQGKKEELKIPSGTQSGHEFRLRGKGIPRLQGSGQGDHVVEAALKVPHPKELNEVEIELLRRLGEIRGKELSEHRGVLDKLRDLFT